MIIDGAVPLKNQMNLILNLFYKGGRSFQEKEKIKMQELVRIVLINETYKVTFALHQIVRCSESSDAMMCECPQINAIYLEYNIQ